MEQDKLIKIVQQLSSRDEIFTDRRRLHDGLGLNGPDFYFASKVSSISISIGIVAVSCVLALPLFSQQRSENLMAGVIGIPLYVITIILLSVELWSAGIIQRAVGDCCQWLTGMIQWSRGRYEQIGDAHAKHHQILAWVFFVCYSGFNCWRFFNEVQFMFVVQQCSQVLYFLPDFLRGIISMLIILTIVYKEELVPADRSSYFVWAIAGATCFYTAFSYIVEEMIYAYIDIIEKSIENPDYGLDIPPNITRVEDYIEQIFKQHAICLEHNLLADVPLFESILELVPFSTEFFCLATFTCFNVWRNLDPAVPRSGGAPPVARPVACRDDYDDIIAASTPKKSLSSARNAEKDSANLGRSPSTKSFTSTNHPTNAPSAHAMPANELQQPFIPAALAIAFSIIISIISVLSILAFYYFASRHQFSQAVWIYHIQVTSLRFILFAIELGMYFKLKNIDQHHSPPAHFQLDVLLLIVPLLPMAIMYTLRVAPDIMILSETYTDTRALSTFLNIALALINWSLSAYQAFFLCKLLCILDPVLKRFKSVFCILAVINICLWACWTFEFKTVVIRIESAHIYGVVQWTIVMFSTVPFILFGVAHSAACLLEVITNIH